MGIVIGIIGLISVPLGIWALIKAGVIETPAKSLEKQMEEANEEAREISRYRKLSTEGQLLYDLNKTQNKIEHYVRGVYWIMVCSAVISLAIAIALFVYNLLHVLFSFK